MPGIVCIPNATVDTLLSMKAAGAITADTADSNIIDTGSGPGQVLEGVYIIDITAIDIASNDETYTLHLQGSNSASFASGNVVLAATVVGKGSSIVTNGADQQTGRIVLPFRNDKLGTVYRYLRAYTDVAGTTPSIDYTSRISYLK